MNRIIVSKNGDGWFNLASDGFLLEAHRRGALGGVTLFFYTNDSAIIIGRNQNAYKECDLALMERDGVQLVRRHTGGGAVYHDRGNLNFSFIADERLYDKERQNRVVIDALARLGVKAEVSGRNDFTVGGKKVSGCAYALSGTARGMHGTLLVNADLAALSKYLRPSEFKLRAKGISSVRARVGNISDFVDAGPEDVLEAFIRAFGEEYGDCADPVFVRTAEDAARTVENDSAIPYDSTAMRAFGELFERKYREQRSWEWRIGAAPAFDFTAEGRCSFGEVQICLKVVKGIVRSADVFTDSLDVAVPEKISAPLTGRRFDVTELAEALRSAGPEAGEAAELILGKGLFEMLDKEEKDLIIKARHELHALAEPSLQEKKTKEYLIDFIKGHTSLRICDMGRWFYAVKDEGADETYAVRADFDAVDVNGCARHLCGHDGHSAALLGLALLINRYKTGRNVILLFQHAEETGEGAEECLGLFDREKVKAVFGAHNIPGEPLGTVLLKRGTFACASCGMEIRMQGRPTHAAYPENGVNPTGALAALTLRLGELAEDISEKYSCMTLATTVGLNAGGRAFGVAASEGSLCVTLRSERTEALNELVERTGEEASSLAKKHGLGMTEALFDVFPATVNDAELVSHLEKTCVKYSKEHRFLAVPFRWSEDFGHFRKRAKAAFFGVGSGENTAPLHTEDYEYPDECAVKTAEFFFKLVSFSE